MPSFTFFTDKEKANVDPFIRNNPECIVPEGFEGTRGDAESQRSNLRWHCATHTPIELHQSSGHGYAFLIGEAIAADSDNYLSAAELFEFVTKQPDEAAAQLSRYSGFFAWIVVLDDESVYCGSDPLGLFPIYYFQGKQSLSISTSLKSLHAHPEYDPSIDPVGFCRYLLEGGCCSHRTLEKSGKRLNVTESLSYDPESNQLTQVQHPSPGQHAVKSVYNLDEAVQLSAEALNKAVKRHTQRSVDTCLLSGGLDSRQILSSAHKFNHRPKCVTLGNRASYESIHARKAARKMNLSWECSGNYSGSPTQILNDELNLFSLGGGFNGLTHSWAHVEALRGTRCLTGLCLDVMYAPSRESIDDTTIGSYAHAKEKCLYRYGAIPEALPSLFKNEDFKDALETAFTEVRAEWDTFPKDPSESYWHTIMRFRTRAHHGRLAWKNAFHFWPIIPGVDVPLIETLRSIDGILMRDRKLQVDTFISEQPELAMIPFASVSARPRPLLLTKRNKHYRRLQKLERASLQFKNKYFTLKASAEDTSELCWKEAKAQALSHLDSFADIFDIESVKQHLDSFHKDDKSKNSLDRAGYSQRHLIGGLCWLASRKNQASNPEQ